MERERAHAKDAKRRNDEMKITLKVAEKTIEEITIERDEASVRLKETEVLLAESEKHVEDAETRVQEAKQSLTQLKASLDFANSRSKELEAKLLEAEEQDSPTRLSTADSAREEIQQADVQRWIGRPNEIWRTLMKSSKTLERESRNWKRK